MIAAFDDTPTAFAVPWRKHLLSVVTIVGWLIVAVTIARAYIGHSSSPYGVCSAPSGRSVSCAAAAPHSAAR